MLLVLVVFEQRRTSHGSGGFARYGRKTGDRVVSASLPEVISSSACLAQRVGVLGPISTSCGVIGAHTRLSTVPCAVRRASVV